MSTPPAAPGPGGFRCPRCDAPIAMEQDWCLSCGAPARTRLAPTPNWRAPLALVAAIIALSGLALGVAFVTLTGEDDEVQTTDTVQVQTQTPTGTTNPALPPTTPTTAAPAATVPPATPTPPATTAPPATATPPATTAPAATTPAIPTVPEVP